MSVNGSSSLSGNHGFPPHGRKRTLSPQHSNSTEGSSNASSNRTPNHHNNTQSDQKQTRLKFSPAEKRIRLTQPSQTTANNHCHLLSSTSAAAFSSGLKSSPSSSFEPEESLECGIIEMAQNNRVSLSNNFAAVKAAGLNNHTKKPGQGKKLVIKNRKGMIY